MCIMYLHISTHVSISTVASTKIPSMCAHGKGNQSLSLRPSDLLHHIINELTRYPVRCDSWNSLLFKQLFRGNSLHQVLLALNLTT